MFSGATKSDFFGPKQMFFWRVSLFLLGGPGCLVPVFFNFWKQTFKTLVSKLLLTSLLQFPFFWMLNKSAARA